MATKPSSHLNWTDGDAAKVQEPTVGKKLLGWVANERPPAEFFNWLFWRIILWVLRWPIDGIYKCNILGKSRECIALRPENFRILD